MPRLFLLDTDVGMDVDDAYCLALVARSQELTLLGVTTVYGNVRNRARIARALLHLCGRPEVPVLAGAARPVGGAPFPLQPEHLRSWDEGGHEGRGILDKPDLAVTGVPPAHAVSFLIETLRSAPGPVTVGAMGPLTNLAVALLVAPDIAEHVERVLMMGGCLNPAAPTMQVGTLRLTPRSEYNITADPYAAEVVFNRGLSIVMTPRETTNRVPTTQGFLNRLAAHPTPLVQTLLELTDIWAEVTRRTYAARGVTEPVLGGLRGWLHDPLAILPAITPVYTRLTRLRLRLEYLDGTLRTIPDDAAPLAVDVMTDVDEQGFYDFLLDRLTHTPNL